MYNVIYFITISKRLSHGYPVFLRSKVSKTSEHNFQTERMGNRYCEFGHFIAHTILDDGWPRDEHAQYTCKHQQQQQQLHTYSIKKNRVLMLKAVLTNLWWAHGAGLPDLPALFSHLQWNSDG